ncbi:MAG: deoxyribose-phosphate aldolase [Pseudomonadota bacterium]
MTKDKLDSNSMAQYIDHTLLRPEATEEEILKVCDEAVSHHFKTVCVEAKWIPTVATRLKGSRVLPITVISFPHGSDLTEKKRQDTRLAVEAGAKEIDMVLNRSLLAKKDFAAVWNDIHQVVLAAQSVPVKVILETSELTDVEKRIACALVKSAGAHFVKTSTGFSKSGATENDIRLMRETVGDGFGVKASGGIRSYDDAVKMIKAGATRLGTSASVAIVQGATSSSGAY